MKILGVKLIPGILFYGFVYFNKTVFRPAFRDIHFVQVLTGSFPSFIAAFLIGLVVVNPVLVKKPRFGRLIVFCVKCVLILDELKSIGASTQFDINDMAGSIIGSVLAVII